MPKPVRIVCLASPFGSQTMPNRGPSWLYWLKLLALLVGKPGSPLYIKPSGAFGYTVLRMPLSKFSRLQPMT